MAKETSSIERTAPLLISGVAILDEKNLTSDTTTKSFYAGGIQVAQMVNYTISYLHQDALGSTRLVMPASMTPSFDANYVPYGMSYAMMGEETFQYTGKLLDEATHRVFLQPKLGIGLLLEPNKCWLKKELRRKRTRNIVAMCISGRKE